MSRLATRSSLALAVLLAAWLSYTGELRQGALHARTAAATSEASTTTAARQFLDTYVETDGRVVRYGQGDDTVSEGQAYALLLAVALGDQATFDQVWGWTQANLSQPDGLLAWHWANGAVVDTMPASDADLNTAWALDLASQRFGDPSDAAAARQLSAAILDNETVPVPGGLLLVAGPWARGEPATFDPSYFSPLAFSALYALTSDARWAAVAATARAFVDRLTSGPNRLPPDWATVDESGNLADIPPPGNDVPAAYGLDAARLEVQYATSCRPDTVPLSARSWPILAGTADQGQFPISLSLSGQPLSTDVNPLMAVADASAAAASGYQEQAGSLLADADEMAQRFPSYYGAAWLALGELLLTTGTLGSCPRA